MFFVRDSVGGFDRVPMAVRAPLLSQPSNQASFLLMQLTAPVADETVFACHALPPSMTRRRLLIRAGSERRSALLRIATIGRDGVKTWNRLTQRTAGVDF